MTFFNEFLSGLDFFDLFILSGNIKQGADQVVVDGDNVII